MNTIMRYNRIASAGRVLMCMVLMLCHYACNVANLDLCYDEHPHKGQLIVDFDWSALKIEEPDSMIVVALRPVFRDKMSCNWATAKEAGEKRLFGRLIAPCEGEGRKLFSKRFDKNPKRDSLFLPAGEWVMSAYTSTNSAMEATKQYTENLMSDDEMFFFRMDTYDRLPEKYAYWYDRNSYSTWVDVSDKSTVCFANARLVVDENANERKDYKVTFKPSSMAQNVTVSFDAEVDDPDIVVDSIVCSLSGIVAVMNLQTNVLDIEKTYQGIYKSDIKPLSDRQIKVSGTIHVPGILRSTSHTFLQGPGILSVSVFVKYTDKSNVRRQRRLDGTTNLYWLLTEHPSVKYDEEGNVVQACQDLDLHIRTKLLISRGKLSNAGEALDSWIDETVIDTEI